MIKHFLVASALTILGTGVRAGGDLPGVRATSVAEMLQTKQLRGQLAREGRWEEIRKLDDEMRQKHREQREQLYSKLNNEISKCEAPAYGNSDSRADAYARNTANSTAPLVSWLNSLLPAK